MLESPSAQPSVRVETPALSRLCLDAAEGGGSLGVRTSALSVERGGVRDARRA